MTKAAGAGAAVRMTKAARARAAVGMAVSACLGRSPRADTQGLRECAWESYKKENAAVATGSDICAVASHSWAAGRAGPWVSWTHAAGSTARTAAAREDPAVAGGHPAPPPAPGAGSGPAPRQGGEARGATAGEAVAACDGGGDASAPRLAPGATRDVAAAPAPPSSQRVGPAGQRAGVDGNERDGADAGWAAAAEGEVTDAGRERQAGGALTRRAPPARARAEWAGPPLPSAGGGGAGFFDAIGFTARTAAAREVGVRLHHAWREGRAAPPVSAAGPGR